MTHNAFHLGVLIVGASLFTIIIVCTLVYICNKWDHDDIKARSTVSNATYWKNQVEKNQELTEYYSQELHRMRAIETKEAE